MLNRMSMTIAILVSVSAAICAEEKSLAQKNLEWHYDANGNIDSCKDDVPSPFTNVPADARKMFDQAVEACHQKKAAAVDDAAKRQRDMAVQRAAQKAATKRAADAHERYLKEHNLTQVSVVDLQANGKNMAGGHIAVQGYVRIISEDLTAIYTSTNDVNGVRLDLSGANPQTRRRVFSLCSDLYNPCQIEIAGTVAFDDHVLVQVE